MSHNRRKVVVVFVVVVIVIVIINLRLVKIGLVTAEIMLTLMSVNLKLEY